MLALIQLRRSSLYFLTQLEAMLLLPLQCVLLLGAVRAAHNIACLLKRCMSVVFLCWGKKGKCSFLPPTLVLFIVGHCQLLLSLQLSFWLVLSKSTEHFSIPLSPLYVLSCGVSKRFLPKPD